MINKIKAELKQLRHLNHSIATLQEMEQKLKERLAYLKSKATINEDEIAKVEKTLSTIDLSAQIRRSIELEAKYMRCILNLPPIDQTIILEGVVNGTHYWKVAQKVGYSVEGLKKRIPLAISKIAKMLANESRTVIE